MYPRTNYEMTTDDLSALLAAMKPVPYIVIGGRPPRSQQDNANEAWAALGEKMGFDSMTVQPIPGKGDRFFSAVPSETDIQRSERLTREAEEKRLRELGEIEAKLSALQARRNQLLGANPS